jgi:hypothetical protein
MQLDGPSASASDKNTKQIVKTTSSPSHKWLEDQGFRVLRFWNNEVLSNTGGVLDTIMAAADPSPGTPLRGVPPSPTRGEGKKNCES